jgi:hypothetical protein
MKTQHSILVAGILLLASVAQLFGQAGSAAERKAFREYTSPEELVSIAPTTTLDKALAAISEVSKKFLGKVVIDAERRTSPVNVDI